MTSRDYHKQIENGIEYTIMTEGNFTEWHLDGKLHRESGPAYIYINAGIVLNVWFIDGKEVPFEFYSKEEYEKKLKLLAFW